MEQIFFNDINDKEHQFSALHELVRILFRFRKLKIIDHGIKISFIKKTFSCEIWFFLPNNEFPDNTSAGIACETFIRDREKNLTNFIGFILYFIQVSSFACHVFINGLNILNSH